MLRANVLRWSRSIVTRFFVAGVLPLAICMGFTLHQAAQTAHRQDVQKARGVAATAATDVARNFSEWRNQLLIAASDDALTRWYTDPARRGELIATFNADLVRLNTLYPGLVDEGCIIDARGRELAREVKGKVAPQTDLSSDESHNPFFASTVALAAGGVVQHEPYVSPDSKRWVISNSTPIAVQGRNVALFHFETSLEGLRDRLAGLVGHDVRARIIDTRTGRLLADTAGPAVADAAFASRDKIGSVKGTTSAAAAVRAGEGNANDWKVEAYVPNTSVFSASTVRSLMALLVFALGVLLVLAIRAARTITRPLARMTAVAHKIADGDLTQELDTNGDDDVSRMGQALNQMRERLRELLAAISESAATLSSSSEELSAVSTQMSTSAEEASTKAGIVSVAAEEVSASINTVASASEEMTSSVAEIAEHATHAATVASEAVVTAAETNATVTRLGTSSKEIGDVVNLITSIAQQTNLLALNATIEAARAGDAGKGFAVVAHEVQELAQETAKATSDIAAKIASIQGDTSAAVDAIERISETIVRINDSATTIAAAVEEQTATTNEIGRSLSDAATGSSEIAENITAVASAAVETTAGATNAREATTELAQMASDLAGLVSRFRH